MHILSFEKDENKNRLGVAIQKKCDQAGIFWHTLHFHTRPKYFAKYYDRYLLVKKAFELIKKHHFEIIHCRSYLAAEIGLKLKSKFGCKLLFDMRGFWADEKKESGHWNITNPIYRFVYSHYKQVEYELVQKSDHIISLTHAGKKELEKLYGTDSGKKTTVIPCCADLNHFDFNKISEEEIIKKKKELAIPLDAKVMMYSGSLNAWYIQDDMVSIFKAYQKENPHAIFLFLTRDRDQVKELCSRNSLRDSFVRIAYSDYAELPVWLMLGDVAIFLIKDLYSKKGASPTKHAELMGMGIPVLCNDIGDTGYYTIQNKIGVLVKKGKEEEAISQLNNMDLKRAEIREVAMTYFNVRKGVDLYAQVYYKMLN